MAEQSSALVGAHATVEDALDMRSLTVIGVVEAFDGPAALLRSSRGDIARVAVGEEAFGVTITAIGTEEVILTNRWGQTEALALPAG